MRCPRMRVYSRRETGPTNEIYRALGKAPKAFLCQSGHHKRPSNRHAGHHILLPQPRSPRPPPLPLHRLRYKLISESLCWMDDRFSPNRFIHEIEPPRTNTGMQIYYELPTRCWWRIAHTARRDSTVPCSTTTKEGRIRGRQSLRRG